MLEESDIGFAYCSAACGADILFIEQALARDIEVNVTLPFAREDFVRTSVAFAGGEWVGRFERALEKASMVGTCVDEGFLGDEVLYGFCQKQLQGTAMLRAQQLETEALLVAVADPGSPEEPGGTQAILRAWSELGGATRKIDLAELRRGSAVETRKASTASCTEESISPIRGRRQIRTMLFGDVAGFSKLREEEAPSFFVNFLGLVADQIRQSKVAPEVRNTWGDGLYLVYDNVAAAADFALRLRDRIARNDWQAQGLPQGLNARIGMHSGPVFRAFDPIIARESFFGSHVTRAARIEPVAAPGSVYVSEQTAALLSAGGHREFACDYLGNMTLAKGYGSSALYRLRRTAEED
jgi:class 3 adenylate cyclase